jgi:hypothetical protein
MKVDGPQKRKPKYSRNPVPFKLSAALENDIHFLVSTTLPSAKHINKLWDLVTDIRDEIAWCLNMVYSHITMRGANGEGQEYFFHHVAGTALYESHHGKLIKGKNHGLKAGTILQKVIKTIDKIKSEINSSQNIIEEHLEILENFKAELIAHHNTLISAILRLPQKAKDHLQKHQGLNLQALKPIELTSEEEKRLEIIHPKPEQITPKKLTLAARKSQKALQSTEPPKRDFESIFAQLIKGTTLEKQKTKSNERPQAIKKLFFDKEPANEIDAIFAQLEQKSYVIKSVNKKKDTSNVNIPSQSNLKKKNVLK